VPGGFSHPWVVFLGSLWNQERSFIREVLTTHARGKYPNLIEPCAGSFAISLMGRDIGWDPQHMDTTDVSLYSAVIGAVAAGDDLHSLGVCVDGKLLQLEGLPHEQAGHILATQLIVRGEARYVKNPSDYLGEVLHDFRERMDDHESSLAERIKSIADRMSGVRYRSMDLIEHTAETMGDPNNVIVLNPPTYLAGYEKFFNTDGRFTWDEPEYSTFDPYDGIKELMDMTAGQPALVLVLQETEPGNVHGKPVYVRQASMDRYTYYLSNRPEEILGALGGYRVVPRNPAELTAADLPLLPPDYELTENTKVEVIRVAQQDAGYFKDLWSHKIAMARSSMNYGVLLDGYLAGIGGLDHSPMSHPHAGADLDSWTYGCLMLTYGFGPYHYRYKRLNRLMTRIGMSRQTVNLFLTPANSIFLEAADRMLSVEMTKHPESKGMRGLMKLVKRVKEGPGWRLMYRGDIVEDKDWTDLYREWFQKEEKWYKSQEKT